ncbi:MAG: hypothetical protein C0501_08025 [Isosphaera sp.]|nr:hypothetical protein [Isosphaera sp.]
MTPRDGPPDMPAAAGPRGRWWRRAAGTAVAAALAAVVVGGVVVAGCGGPPDYPSTLAFPARADRLVRKTPTAPPPGPNEPGKLDAELAALDAAGGTTVDPGVVPAATRTALDKHLKDVFGTPSAPTIATEPDAAGRLGLSAGKLAEGGKLFRRHCLQCHNLAGDGRGPSGYGSTPYPRDYRRGVFKFTTTGTPKPRHADLLRTLADGLKGTTMPPFGLLPEGERELLARYVVYLSARGQVEFETLAAAAELNVNVDPPAFAAGRLKAVLKEWQDAADAPPPAGVDPQPDDGDPGSPAHADAVRRGYALFTAKADNSCVSCHDGFGAKAAPRYDAWGTAVKPANLLANLLKGGSRPEDVFARIRGGIPAVGMPARPELDARQVWDLVRFVKSLPFPAELPPDVRAAVHPNP